MSKIAFIFAGQGSQYIGMGKAIAQGYKASDEVFEAANASLGFNIKGLCFEGQKEELDLTENTQPAVLTTSIAILRAVQEHGIQPHVVAGLSLGEYSALVCNEAMNFSTAVQLVKKRGKFMQEAVPQGQGTMAAIIGLDREKVQEICQGVSQYGIVEPANFNCPGQIVVAGETKAIEAACKMAKEAGARRALPLAVSAPFHSSMLEPAANQLERELKRISVKKHEIPYISNVTGKYVDSEEEIKPLLKKQVMTSVLWEDTIRRMIGDGVDTFVEIGPGKALSGFVKKIDRSKKIYNVEDPESLQKLVEGLGGKAC